MTRIWQPDGSNAQFWRSDNPLIQGWWRFGDNIAPSSMTTGANTPFLSGLLVDSGPMHSDLIPFYTTTDQATIFPVPGIAPWATSGSGIQFRWDNSLNTQRRSAIYLPSPRDITDPGGNLTPHYNYGYLSNGYSMYSGFTVIGWAQIPDSNPTITGFRKIVGRGDRSFGDNYTRIEWQQTAVGGPYTLNLAFRSMTNLNPGNSSSQNLSLASNTSPHFPTNRNTPFFFAAQFRYSNDINNRNLCPQGNSGMIALYVGTAASGIVASTFRTLTPVNTGSLLGATVLTTGTSVHNFSFGGDPSTITINTSANSFLPSGSIIDEVVWVGNGYLSSDRIAHYALSGMTYIATSDPDSSSFTPEYPGTDNLVAYWSFDQSNGNNTAPATRNEPGLYFSLSGQTSFVSGIRGGRALRSKPSLSAGAITGGNGCDGSRFAQRATPGIVSQSGLQYLFPSGTLDEGMTWIGWIRSPVASSPYGSTVGWLGSGARHTRFDFYAAGATQSFGQLTQYAQVSGFPLIYEETTNPRGFRHSLQRSMNVTSHVRVVTGGSSNLEDDIGAFRGIIPSGSSGFTATNEKYTRGSNDWHLWAYVMDLKAGQTYLVKDAYQIIPGAQVMVSGFSSDGLGPDGGIWTLCDMNTSVSSISEFDDWAVYKKILTLPEMSGYALLGIRTPAPTPYLSTPMVSLVGYWPLDGITTYGSNSRVDDDSWYRHHLTNVSGSFTITSALNSEDVITTGALRVGISGSMLSVPLEEHGPNLDMSSANSWGLSGMCAGAWLYLPSGDLGTLGRGTSGLYGDHMIMGAWDQDINQCSWFLGIKDNKFHIKVRTLDTNLFSYQTYEYTSNMTVPFNTPFFIACNIAPSGYEELGYDAAYAIEMYYANETETEAVVRIISNNTSWTSNTERINSCGPSGFSILNVPHLQYGFPSGTVINNAFVHLGKLSASQLLTTKRSSVNNITLGSGSVSSNDPACISHWKMDNDTLPSEDSGPEQNKLTLINNDNAGLQLVRGYHNSGIYLRTNDCLDTLAYNSQARRLDLGSGTQSWTFLGWIFTPAEAVSQDRKFIMNKAGNDGVNNSGIQIFMPESALALTADASGITVGANNGVMSTASWNHIAIVYNRTDNKFINIVNGRYAGLTQLRSLVEIPVNASGMALGGRGADNGIPFDSIGTAGGGFSGILDDIMIFGRALTLPEISGLAANSYNFNERPNAPVTGYFGGYISGIPAFLISGLIGSYLYGQGQDISHIGSYVNAVSGIIDHAGGYLQGMAISSGVIGSFMHGFDRIEGLYAGFLHGLGIASGVIGVYTLGAGQENSEFDITFNFQIVAAQEFDSRLEVVKSAYQNFDASLGVFRITTPPECLIQTPAIGFMASGTPYTLTVQGSGWVYDDKSLGKVRFTFADFKGAAIGQFISGSVNSGLYQASRTFDTPGWYTIKMEVTDSYGYRGSHCRPFLLVPSGSTSGAYLATLPYIAISGTPVDGTTIHRAFFTHSLSGLPNTSGILEYTDFADQQESLVNSTEVPSGTQFVNFVRTHDYTMPGTYAPVWAVSGSWGIASDSASPNTDYGD